MSASTAHAHQGDRSRLFPLLAVTASALLTAVLLLLVRVQGNPLERVDHSLAADLSGVDRPTERGVLQTIAMMGSPGAVGMLVVAGLILLAVRRRYRLAGFLAIAGVGAVTLGPILKALLGAHVAGDSFPSVHAFGSIVCFGALLLVFLPAVPDRARTAVTIAVAVPAVVIALARTMMGAPYLSDIVGGWALGVAWLGATAYAFEIVRDRSGQPVTRPLTEGLEPEAAASLAAVPEQPAQSHRARIAAGIVAAWFLILGTVVGIGELVTRYGGGNVAGDETIPHWLAAHRTPGLTRLSVLCTAIGDTRTVLAVTVLALVVTYAVTRRWRPVIFLALVMAGEGSLFITTQAIVKRERPDVARLEHHIPTTSFPSGHVAAAICIYLTIAILVVGRTQRWWRWPVLVVAVLLPVLVATSRMYRGAHHPTDVLGSTILAALLLAAMYRAVRPNARVAARPRGHKSADTPLAARETRPPVAVAHSGTPGSADHG